MPSIVSFAIDQFHQGEDQQWLSHLIVDHIISEEPLEIWLKVLSPEAMPASLLLTLMRTPGDDLNLVTGWLYTSGIIESLASIYSINHTGQGRLKNTTTNQILVTLVAGAVVDITQQQRQEYVNSACGVCGQQSIEQLLSRLERVRATSTQVASPLSLSTVTQIAAKLFTQQPLFQQTGGNHGVALFDTQQNIIDVREDVGRHNALDKLIGANAQTLLHDNTVTETAPMGVILSGRVGFEMIQKAAMANIRYVLAFGAPSSLAIELALETDIALLGFIKNRGFNIYCNLQLLRP
ncbi:formate dehydrogenase accessory sulfurtransferase FdhD [Paraglaciecola sp. 25GB23A]|uniref:formate dehydrogenase accessory sulfurtransferase FdhD n=1 Tax=Paraglaciecola sp. 25GB23A TaxID=3156068 RepID=UPI0032AF4FF6